jgi:hypothetical protein
MFHICCNYFPSLELILRAERFAFVFSGCLIEYKHFGHCFQINHNAVLDFNADLGYCFHDQIYNDLFHMHAVPLDEKL